MTDERSGDQGPEPGFDDPAYAGIRDLLASARVDGPIPAEVAARLDATLAELTGRPTEAPVPDEDSPVVVPLRRRSRLAPRLLAAAAVVIVAGVGGVGLNQVLSNSGSDNKASSADSAVKSDEAGSAKSPLVPTATVAQPADGLTSGGARSFAANGKSVLVLTTAGFADQAAGIDFASTARLGNLTQSYDASAPSPVTPPNLAGSPDARGSTTVPGPTLQSTTAERAGKTLLLSRATDATSCRGPKIDGTDQYPVVLDGQPAVLVVHPVNAGTRLVEAWACDGSQVLAFTTVPG